jgi:hypothetical protein
MWCRHAKVRYRLLLSRHVYTVQKVVLFPVHSRDVRCHYDKTLPGQLFSARESLVSDIPAGDGKNENLFLQCRRSTFCNVLNCFIISLVDCGVAFGGLRINLWI